MPRRISLLDDDVDPQRIQAPGARLEKAATQGLYCSSPPETSDRYPMRQILPAGCASALSGATRLKTTVATMPSILSLMAGYSCTAGR